MMPIELRVTGILDPSLRSLKARPFDPLTTFVNLRTGGMLITRDTAIYRRVPEWEEQPFNRQSPVPRRAS